MIRQQAFGSEKKLLKGALHCHTTRSDGKGSPEEVIGLHQANGYDFMAITDHRLYNYSSFGTDMLIIPGMEFDNTIEHGNGFRCFHTVVIGPEKEAGNGFSQDESFESGTAKNQEEYQEYLDKFHGNKNLTIYCHPEWSSTPARYFEKLKGNFAMEIWNTGCAMENHMDTDAAYWDELLGQNIRIFGVATDDGHSMDQHCGGWVMVNAEKNVESILKALQEGAFYSSCGPEIKDFGVDGATVWVECSPCRSVRFLSDMHPTYMVTDENGNITRAEFVMDGDWAGGYNYIRVTVEDSQGRRAWTNPIFLK